MITKSVNDTLYYYYAWGSNWYYVWNDTNTSSLCPWYSDWRNNPEEDIYTLDDGEPIDE